MKYQIVAYNRSGYIEEYRNLNEKLDNLIGSTVREMLEKYSKVEITKWDYKGERV